MNHTAFGARLRYIFIFGLLLALSLCPGIAMATQAHALMAKVTARLPVAPVIRGEFVQRRQIEGFSKALKSSGRFVAARGIGVIWDTATPFPNRLVITPDAMRESSPDGDSSALDASQEPALREVNRILLAVLEGDLAKLGTHFEISGEASDAHWELNLKPRGDVAQVIKQITVGGATYIETVVIAERNGDRSEISFSAHSVLPAALSSSESSALAP